MPSLQNPEQVLNFLDNYKADNYKEVLADKEPIGEMVHHGEGQGYSKAWLTRPNDPFLVGLYRWPPGSTTTIHDHGNYATVYYKVLGEVPLTNIVYAKVPQPGEKYGLRSLRTESIVPWRAIAILPFYEAHRVTNLENEVAYSIHIYTPKFESHREWKDENDAA